MYKSETLSFDSLEQAEQHVRNAPQDYDALLLLSRFYYDAGRFSEAVEAVRKSEGCDPLMADFQTIQQAMQSRDYGRARDVALKMLHQKPGHPRAVYTLHHLNRMQGEHEESLKTLDEAIALLPANLMLRQALIRACEDSGLFERAVEEARLLITIQKDFSNYWVFMNVCLRYGFYQDMLDVAHAATSAAQNDSMKISELKLLCGHAERIIGQRDKAIQSYQSCLEDHPQNGAAWWALADLKTYQFSPPEQQRMKEVSESASVHPLQKCQALFALAKSYEGEGDLEQAMSAYHQANDLHPANPFNVDGFGKAIDRIRNAFSQDVLSQCSVSDSHDATPIFILGLPRSGSTLIEQILASHTQIEGTLELLALPSVKREAHRICVREHGGHYLDEISSLSADTLETLGRSYLDRADFFKKEKTPFFIDKLPHNFEHVGLIRKILPNAIIIDARRNPMDCGYSLYKQYFSAGSGFSYNLGSIGAYYNGYLKLMDHWDAHIPGAVIRVQYEELVKNPAMLIRGLLDLIGVSFEQNCLDFHKNNRAVRTASSEQVRQPIYNNSIGAWQSVEEHLVLLQTSLGKETLDRFKTYMGD